MFITIMTIISSSIMTNLGRDDLRAPEGTNTKVASAKGRFCAYPICAYGYNLSLSIHIYIYIYTPRERDYIYIYICV